MRKAILVGCAVLLALLVFFPSSQAAPADLVATSGVPVKLYGDAEIKTRDGVLVLREPGQLSFVGQNLYLERVRVVSSYARTATGLEALGERRVDVQPFDLGSANVQIQTLADSLLVLDVSGATLRASQAYDLDKAPTDLWLRSASQLGLLLAPESLAPELPALRLAQLDTAPEIPGARSVAQGTYHVSARDASLSAKLHEIVLVEGYVHIDGTEYRSMRTVVERPGGVFVPGAQGGAWSGPGTHMEETLDYMVLETLGSPVTFDAEDATLYTEDVILSAKGFIGFPWAEGAIETSEERHRLSGEQVVLGGDLRLRPVGRTLDGAPSLTLLGEGDVQFVQIGLRPDGLAKEEVAVVAGGAAAGLGLVALAIYYWPVLKYALSAVLVPLYARVPKEQTLDHKGRELLYDLIKNEPGVSTNQLAREVPFGWSTLTYHLRVLERNEAIVSVRDGRYKRFFDRQSGRFSNGRKYILAVLKNDATLGIARYIKDKPGSSQKDVAGTFQLSPSSVHWHVERLSEVGLVSKVREAHNVKYFPGEGWDHVTIEDLKSLEPRPPGPEPAPPTPATPPVVPEPGSGSAA